MFTLDAPRLPRWLRRLSWFLAGATLAGLLLGGRALRSSDPGQARDHDRIEAERAAAARRFAASACAHRQSFDDRPRFADDPVRQPGVRALPAPERLQRGVDAARRGLAVTRCRPSLLALAIGSELIREGVDLAMTAVSDVSPAEREAAAASLADAAGPMLQPDQIIRGDADVMLLDPRARPHAGAILAQRDRALGICGPGVTMARCAPRFDGDLRTYRTNFHRYLDAHTALAALGTSLRTAH